MVLKGGAANEPPGGQLGEVGHENEGRLAVIPRGVEEQEGAQGQIEEQTGDENDPVAIEHLPGLLRPESVVFLQLRVIDEKQGGEAQGR